MVAANESTRPWWRRGLEYGVLGLTLLAFTAMARVRGVEWVVLPLSACLLGCIAYRRYRWIRFPGSEVLLVLGYFAFAWWLYLNADTPTRGDGLVQGLDVVGLVILYPAQIALWTGRRSLQELVLLGLVAVSQFLYGMTLASWGAASWALGLAFFPLLVFSLIEFANARALEGVQAEPPRPHRLFRRDAMLAFALLPVMIAIAAAVFYVLPRRSTMQRAFFAVDGKRGGREAPILDGSVPDRRPKRLRTGVGNSMNLRSGPGRLERDETPVFSCTLELETAAQPLNRAYENRIHLRARILDDYNGEEWTTTAVGSPRTHRADSTGRIVLPEGSARPGWGTKLEVWPLASRRRPHRLVVAAGRPCVVEAPCAIVGYPDEALRFTRRLREGERYVVASERVLQWGDAKKYIRRHRLRAGHPELDHYTRIPERPDEPRIAELAKRLTLDASDDADRVQRLIEHVRRTCRYTLEIPPLPNEANPTASFLFATRRGHCEFFSDAVAMLCRHAGIPARIANGYHGGEWVDFPAPRFLFRARDAHAWCEIHFEGLGWVGVDPSPQADSRSLGLLPPIEGADAEIAEVDLGPTAFGADAQMSLYRRAMQYLGAASRSPLAYAGLAIAVMSLWWWRRSRRRVRVVSVAGETAGPSDPVVRLFRALARHGIHPQRGETVLEIARRAEDVLEVSMIGEVERVYAVRFGGVSLSDDERRAFDRWVRAVARAQPRALSPVSP